MVNDGSRGAGCDGFCKLKRIRRLHSHATVAADARYAGRRVRAVNAQTEFRIAQADKDRTQRIIGAGRYGFDAVSAFFLNRFRNVPSRIKSFGSDFVFPKVGLGHGFADSNGINFC